MPAFSAHSIIKDALIGIGEYQEADIIHDDDAERGLKVLNRMLGQWSNQNLACFSFITQSVALVNDKENYTVGPVTAGYPTPDVIGIRPLQLEQAYLLQPGSQRVRLPVNINTLQDFNFITAPQATSTLPTDLYYDAQDPIATIKVWPVPVSPTNTLFWVSYQQLTEFQNLADEVNFPLGYDDALISNLMVLLSPYFGKAATPDMVQHANQSRGWIKRKNTIDQVAYFDSTLTSNYRGGSGTWNIWTGTYGNRGP